MKDKSHPQITRKVSVIDGRLPSLWILIICCATFLALIYSARGIFMSVGQGLPIDWVIKELHPLFKGEYEILLQNGLTLTSSRRYRAKLDKLLEQ